MFIHCSISVFASLDDPVREHAEVQSRYVIGEPGWCWVAFGRAPLVQVQDLQVGRIH